MKLPVEGKLRFGWGPEMVATEANLDVETVELEERGSVEDAYARLNAISFSRSVQSLRRNFRIVSGEAEEESTSRAS